MFSSNQSNVAAVAANYIEDVFSTYLYTGNGSTQTITNNIDLSTKGGMVWNKPRTAANYPYGTLTDTVRGVNRRIIDSLTDGEYTNGPLSAFNSNGFTINSGFGGNTSSDTYVSWTFREQPKFFDVVTYTGDGTTNRSIAHSLGSAPGCIIVKRTNAVANWGVYHRTQATGVNALLNDADAFQQYDIFGSNASQTSSVFQTGISNLPIINATGGTYVAYIFAHDAGGFGLAGTDNVISCGSFTATGSAQTVTLGYEPQWVLVKCSNNADNWYILDNMRGLPVSEQAQRLYANTSGAEGVSATLAPTATGFSFSNTSNFANSGYTYIYIACRRGPMKVPTLGTSVFQPVTYTGNGTSQSVTTGITGDLTYIKYRTDAGAATFFTDRLRGSSQILESNSSVAEDTSAQHLTSFNQLGFSVGNNGNVNASSGTFISETFKRAPSFFDEVCYTGTGTSPLAVSHNLAAIPEMMIVKDRGNADSWYTYHANASGTPQGSYLTLNSTGAVASSIYVWGNTLPTSSVFTVGATNNTSAYTYVAYLFATCAGVSKVGSYTGTGTTQTINCGFTAGSRFIMIKRTDASGAWYVWDSARGIIAGDDPYLLLNSTAAEVTNTDYIDTYSAGFEISSTAPAAINASAGTFVFLAVA